MDRIDQALVSAALRGHGLGGPVVVVGEVTSTMDVLAALADEGAPEGTVVLADYQSAGRGRLGRTWLAAPGAALLMSVLFRPTGAPDRATQTPMALALGALEALAPLLPARATLGLKWPNDIEVDGRKLAGLLAEAQWPAAGPPIVRVGLGLNVHQDATRLPPGATSLRLVAETAPDRSHLAAAILTAADRHYADLRAGVSLVPRWAAWLTTLGQPVTVTTGQGTVTGTAIGVADDGGLVIRGADDREWTVQAGDVTLRG